MHQRKSGIDHLGQLSRKQESKWTPDFVQTQNNYITNYWILIEISWFLKVPKMYNTETLSFGSFSVNII